MGIQINGNTNNINAGIGSLSIEDLNELHIVGVATAANFKTGTSNLHNTGLNVQDLDVDGHTNLDNVSIAGIATITGDFKVTGAGNGRVEIETQTARTIFRGASGVGIYGETGQNNDANLNLYPTGSAVYTNLFFYNAASNTYASIVGHAGSTLFFTGGTNGVLRHRVSGTGFHSFQEGNTERVRIAANGAIGIAGANYGTSGQVLTSGGSGSSVSWSTITGTTINNNADNRVITGSGTANTLNGESSVIIDSSGNLLIDATGVGNASVYARNIFISGSSNNGITIHTTDTSGVNRKCCLFFGTGTSVADMADGMLFYDHSGQYMHLSTAGAGTGVTKSSIRLHSDGTVRFDSTPTTTNSISLLIKSHKARAVGDNNGILFRDANDHSQGAINVEKKSTSDGSSDLVFRTSGGQVVTTLQGIPERMRIDSSGRVTQPYQPSFQATFGSSSYQIASNAGANLVFTSEEWDTGSNYDTSNGRFTAPIAGKYFFGIQLYLGFSVTSVRVMHSYFSKNGSVNQKVDLCGGIGNFGNSSMNSYHPTAAGTCMMTLNANDYVHFNIGSPSFIGSGNTFLYPESRFFGYLVG